MKADRRNGTVNATWHHAVAKEYAAYLLHDFYDDRETVLALLREKNRIAEEDRTSDDEG